MVTLNMFFFFYEFESTILEILNNANINIDSNSCNLTGDTVAHTFDFVGTRNNEVYGIEIKQYTTLKVSFNTIKDVVVQLSDRRETISNNNIKLILIVSCVLDKKTREQLSDIYSDVFVIDIANLLYAVWENEELKSNLISSLSYTVENVEPIEGPIELNWLSHSNYTENLIKEMELCTTGKETFKTYEILCYKLLKNAFSNDLTLWKKQQKSNSDLYRFDLICRIKEDNEKTFWSIVEKFFRSKYIIFEFKNYKERITQKEIYTTEKYLYAKALRSVAIMIAANGYDTNAQRAAKGAFRENGKLILLLDTKDLIKLNKLKAKGEEPSAYLLDRLDKLLLELEK